MMRDRPAFRLKPEILKTSEIQNRAERLTLAYAEQVGLDAARLGISFQVVYEELIYPDYGIELQEGLDLGSLERQANVFAARAGAPNWLLYHVVNETMDLTRPIRYVGPSKYSLQIRGRTETVTVKSFEHLCWIIGKRIQFRFGWLSAEALGYRIAETSMVKDFTNSRLELNRVATDRRSIPVFAAPVGEILAGMVS